MDVYALFKVYHDWDGNPCLELLSVYDCVDKCHSYINNKRYKKPATNYQDEDLCGIISKNITMIGEQNDDLCCMIDENYEISRPCDYAIQHLVLNR